MRTNNFWYITLTCVTVVMVVLSFKLNINIVGWRKLIAATHNGHHHYFYYMHNWRHQKMLHVIPRVNIMGCTAGKRFSIGKTFIGISCMRSSV